MLLPAKGANVAKAKGHLCLACGGIVTNGNVSGVNPYFHKVCMNEGVRVKLPAGKYSDEELKHTWAEKPAGDSRQGGLF
jgi:hypothetical protein